MRRVAYAGEQPDARRDFLAGLGSATSHPVDDTASNEESRRVLVWLRAMLLF